MRCALTHLGRLRPNGMEMAWNEPGNNKKRDPWQDGEQPDLEETVKQLKERFGRLFSGGGGSGIGLICWA